jgi:hypothetical protein
VHTLHLRPEAGFWANTSLGLVPMATPFLPQLSEIDGTLGISQHSSQMVTTAQGLTHLGMMEDSVWMSFGGDSPHIDNTPLQRAETIVIPLQLTFTQRD